ncbi:MAG: hypothetical protein OXI93_08265, partial [Bryobacterales bacterium]|nr:hypothetical protein [Bryobacterales bacterium]
MKFFIGCALGLTDCGIQVATARMVHVVQGRKQTRQRVGQMVSTRNQALARISHHSTVEAHDTTAMTSL